MTELRARLAPDVRVLDAAAWDACCGHDVEGRDYYVAAAAGTQSAATVWLEDRLVGVVPVERASLRLDAPLQAASSAVLRGLAARLPSLDFLCAGSARADRCHVGVAPQLPAPTRVAVACELLALLDRHAADERLGMVAFKDLAPPDAAWLAPVLQRAGFVPLPSLPIATLALTGSTLDDYLATLSPGTRRDLRRKWRSRTGVRLEDRHAVDDLADRLDALYESTRAHSGLDYGEFETLPPGYFARVGRALGSRALFRLYWVDDVLAGFNLLLLEPGRAIDKYIGMRYPLAREHDLYAVSWLHNVEYCLAHGIRHLQSGQTGYASKRRYGSALQTSTNWFRHRSPLLHAALRALAPLAAFDRHDPELRETRRA